jgi:hypothetical protein
LRSRIQALHFSCCLAAKHGSSCVFHKENKDHHTHLSIIMHSGDAEKHLTAAQRHSALLETQSVSFATSGCFRQRHMVKL